MNIVLSEQDQKITEEEVQNLAFNFEIEKGKSRCEQILSSSPHLYKVRTYYAFFLQYNDVFNSSQQYLQVFKQYPYFFENTSYMLDQIPSFINDDQKVRNIFKEVEEKYINYEGEKDGFYYISLALIHRFNQDFEKSYEILTQNVDNYLQQKEVLCWFYHQMGCHFYEFTQFGQDQKSENAQNAIKYFSKAMEIQPRNTMNIQHIGTQYFQMYSYNEAIEYYTKSLQIIPNDHYAFLNLSYIYQDMYEYQKSFDQIKKCLPNIFHIYNLIQYLNLLLNYSDDLQVNLDNEIFVISKAFEKILNFKLVNQYSYACFLDFVRLIIKHERQFKYMDMLVSITELFRINDPFSLFGLKEEVNKYDYDDKEIIYKMIKIHLNKEIYVISQIAFSIAYENILQNQISFQKNYSHWDLYFD